MARIRFAASGQPGVLRPVQPSDVRPVPVLVDSQTATAATRSGRIALTVDGLPVPARVVGVLARFPTISPDAAGFVVADEPTLASALDAELPGQGRADELWISTAHPERLRAALRDGPLAQLDGVFRGEIEHQLRSAPIASGVLGTLLAATALSGALAIIGLLMALVGGARDIRVERDLAEQGVSPRGLRRELRLRILIAGVIGVGVGLAIGVLLARLAVAAVRAAGTVRCAPPAARAGRAVGRADRLGLGGARGAGGGELPGHGPAAAETEGDVSRTLIGATARGRAAGTGGASDTVIELRDVFCVHRTSEGDSAALQGLDIEVASGEQVCVLGPSGAGKTTLLRVIAGLQAPSAGVVRVLGSDIGRISARSRAKFRHATVGFLDQQCRVRPAARPVGRPGGRLAAAPARSWCVRRGARESASCSKRSHSVTVPTLAPISFPVASVSGSRCARRSRIVPGCCSRMSRRANSTTRRRRPCAG